MMKLRSKRFSRSNSKLATGGSATGGNAVGEIKWELRPGGMLVQKRDNGDDNGSKGMITIRVSTVSQWHNIAVQPTSTFGELKTRLSMVTNLEPKEQRVLFKGKEREDKEHLHMVGVRDKDKVLLLQYPASK